MTQQYLIGQLSLLLAELPARPEVWRASVAALRREVERSEVSQLPQRARDAMVLTDLICWDALEHGDASGFMSCAGTAAALREFADSAGFLRQ